jgi:hypothetical protein
MPVTHIVRALVALTFGLSANLVGQTASWLDRPLAGWNLPAAAVPNAPGESAARDAATARCPAVARSPGTQAEAAVAAAGWLPYWHLDRQLVRDEIEIVAGALAADAQCQPADFNLFVFLSGRFAGTLSPDVMGPGRDGVAGAVRIIDRETISVEYARFLAGDTPCCPSGRVSARFRVEHAAGASAIVVPASLRTSRRGAG